MPRHDMSHGWEDNSTHLNNQERQCFQYKPQILSFLLLFFSLALQTHYIAIGGWYTEVGQTMQTPGFAATSVCLDFGLFSSSTNKAVIITHSTINNMLVYYIVQYVATYTLKHWKLLDFYSYELLNLLLLMIIFHVRYNADFIKSEYVYKFATVQELAVK